MCVIVHQPPGERLTKGDAKKLWDKNPDGGGLAYPRGGKIITYKAMTFKEWWSHYSHAVKRNPKVAFMIHMRIATHGEPCLDNTHPFKVNDTTVMAHNGVIWDCIPNRNDQRSDTRVFVDEVLPRLPEGWLDDDYLPIMVEAFTSSKLMFLTVDPDLQYQVYRLGRWEKHKGLFMSNTYGLAYDMPVTGNRKVSGSYSWNYQPTKDNILAWPKGRIEDDEAWVNAPDDADEYDAWMERMIEEYERKEFHNDLTDEELAELDR